MTAQTINTTPITKDWQLVEHPVLAARKIFSNTPVFVKAASEFAYSNDGTTETLANGDFFMGIATEEKDNLSW